MIDGLAFQLACLVIEFGMDGGKHAGFWQWHNN